MKVKDYLNVLSKRHTFVYIREKHDTPYRNENYSGQEMFNRKNALKVYEDYKIDLIDFDIEVEWHKVQFDGEVDGTIKPVLDFVPRLWIQED